MLENVLGLCSKPTGESDELSNFDFCVHYLEKIGYFVVSFRLCARQFGFPVSRERVYMLAVREDIASAAGLVPQQLQDKAVDLMSRLIVRQELTRDLNDFLLPEKHPLIQEMFRSVTAKNKPDEPSTGDAKRPRTRSARWPEIHARWFKAGKQRLQMNSSESKSKEGLAILKLGTNKRKNEDDLDDIWGPVCCKAVGGPGEGEQDTPPKRGSKEPTVVRRSPQKNPCPAIDKSDKNPDKNKGSSKRAKEIATTEKVTLEIEQTLRLLSDMSTLKTVTPKHVDMLEKKLADRLTPTLIAQYAQNFDVTTELGGMLQQQDELDKLGMSCLEQARDRSGKTSLLGVPQTRNQSQAQTASF